MGVFDNLKDKVEEGFDNLKDKAEDLVDKVKGEDDAPEAAPEAPAPTDAPQQ